MKEYRLLREDIDSLIELSTWPGKKSAWESVDSKVKAALTRAYNKEVTPYTYTATAAIKKKKGVAGNDDEMAELEFGMEENAAGGGGGTVDSENDEDENVDDDVLIKAKKKPTAATSSKKADASTKKTGGGAGSSARGKGASTKPKNK